MARLTYVGEGFCDCGGGGEFYFRVLETHWTTPCWRTYIGKRNLSGYYNNNNIQNPGTMK